MNECRGVTSRASDKPDCQPLAWKTLPATERSSYNEWRGPARPASGPFLAGDAERGFIDRHVSFGRASHHVSSSAPRQARLPRGPAGGRYDLHVERPKVTGHASWASGGRQADDGCGPSMVKGKPTGSLQTHD